MPRVGTESARTTLFQLEALVSALTHGSFAAAASDLGVRDKHRLIKAVERLAENLQIEGLSNRIGDELLVPTELRGLQAPASEVLGAVSDFERAAVALRSRTVVIRCLTYPSIVSIFLAQAVARFEARTRDGTSRAEVRFVDLESQNRREAGSGMLRPILARVVDVAIGPTRRLPSDASTISKSEIYKWQIVAAIHSGHPLQEYVFVHQGQRVVDLEDVARFPLLLSPPGHRSRDLIDEHEPIGGFIIDLETTNSQARAALGRAGVRVPLIASDALIDAEFDSAWPAVVVHGDADDEYISLGDSHSIYWRADLPEAVSKYLSGFVEEAHAAAECLRLRPGGRPMREP